MTQFKEGQEVEILSGTAVWRKAKIVHINQDPVWYEVEFVDGETALKTAEHIRAVEPTEHHAQLVPHGCTSEGTQMKTIRTIAIIFALAAGVASAMALTDEEAGLRQGCRQEAMYHAARLLHMDTAIYSDFSSKIPKAKLRLVEKLERKCLARNHLGPWKP